nr:hypothetical protein [Tanacetum cinerariifolium]
MERPIVVKSVDPFDGLDEILVDYENTKEEITRKQMIVHVGNSSTVDDVLDLEMLFEIEGVGPIRKFKDVEHDEVFDDDEHIVEDVPVSMINFNFITYPKHGVSIRGVEVQDHDLDVIDYDSFSNYLVDGINSESIIQIKKLKE